MDIAFQLPAESPVERNRNTRQVSHVWWAIARRTRFTSSGLRMQATELLRESQALWEQWRRLESRPSQSKAPEAC